MKNISTMTDQQISIELKELGDEWDAFQADIDEGYGGSPGEWMVERMGALECEQTRRKHGIIRKICNDARCNCYGH